MNDLALRNEDRFNMIEISDEVDLKEHLRAYINGNLNELDFFNSYLQLPPGTLNSLGDIGSVLNYIIGISLSGLGVQTSLSFLLLADLISIEGLDVSIFIQEPFIELVVKMLECPLKVLSASACKIIYSMVSKDNIQQKAASLMFCNKGVLEYFPRAYNPDGKNHSLCSAIESLDKMVGINFHQEFVKLAYWLYSLPSVRTKQCSLQILANRALRRIDIPIYENFIQESLSIIPNPVLLDYFFQFVLNDKLHNWQELLQNAGFFDVLFAFAQDNISVFRPLCKYFYIVSYPLTMGIAQLLMNGFNNGSLKEISAGLVYLSALESDEVDHNAAVFLLMNGFCHVPVSLFEMERNEDLINALFVVNRLLQYASLEGINFNQIPYLDSLVEWISALDTDDEMVSENASLVMQQLINK